MGDKHLIVKQDQSEFSLVLFTLFLPASSGLALFSLLFCRYNIPESTFLFALGAFILASCGMVASVIHLAKPLRAPLSILHWKQSWLSREILAVALFWGACLLWVLAVWFSTAAIATVFNMITVVCGVALLFVIAQAYKVRARPAWDGPETTLELLGVSLGVGFPAGASIHAISAFFYPSTDAYIVCVVLYFAVTVALLCALILSALSHRMRAQRMKRALESEDRPNVRLSLENYQKLLPKVKKSLIMQLILLLVFAVGFVFLEPLAYIFWPLLTVLEVGSFALMRSVFYELPIQVRHVPRWR